MQYSNPIQPFFLSVHQAAANTAKFLVADLKQFPRDWGSENGGP
jgi:hypothetical protein